MTDQVTPEGEVLPDANASPTDAAPEGDEPKEGSEAESSPAADPSDKAPPKESGEGLRIKELTRRYREEQRRSDRLMKMLEDRGQEPAPARQQPVARTEQPEKVLADFNYDEQAFRKYERDKAIAETREEFKQTLKQEREEMEFQQRLNAHNARVAKFSATVEDFDVEDARASMPFIHRDMAEAIMDSDESAALEYYLSNNIEEAQRLASLPPARAGREIQKLEDRLVAERKKASEKSVSKAPPPPPKIDGSGDAAVRVSTTSPESDALSDEEWFRAESRRLARKRQKS
jgi:hypothetical protein